MNKKLAGRALARYEAGRDIWQEVLDRVREIKASRGKRTVVQPRSPITRTRIKSGLTQGEFASLLGVCCVDYFPVNRESLEISRPDADMARQARIHTSP